MANSLEVECAPFTATPALSGDELTEATQLMLGKSLFDTREYRRAAHSLEKCNSPKAVFLRLYSLYLVCINCTNALIIAHTVLYIQIFEGHRFCKERLHEKNDE